MNKIVNPFIDFLPKIDLHGMDRICARIAVEEFINDNIKLKNKKIVIIHGIGKGIVKEEVYKVLKNNKNIIDYKLDVFNIGCTIVNLKID